MTMATKKCGVGDCGGTLKPIKGRDAANEMLNAFGVSKISPVRGMMAGAASDRVRDQTTKCDRCGHLDLFG